MRAKKILPIVLAMVLLASAVSMAVTPAGAQQAGIPCDDGDNELTKEELVNAILPYMLDGGAYSLDEVGDAAWVYAYWNVGGVGKPKRITDSTGREVTIYKPIKRIAVLNTDLAEAIVVLGAKDRVVGIGETMTKYKRFFPELSKLPSVGKWTEPDIEAILALNSDTVCAYAKWPKPENLEDKLPDTITVIRLDFYKAETLKEEMEELGYLLDKEEYADRYLEWHDEYVDVINEKVSEISEENKTRVFIDGGGGKVFGRRAYSTGTGMHDLCVVAGGIDIAEGYVEGYKDVQTEWILNQTPDVIVGLSYKGGYETDDDAKMKEHYDTIIGLPGFEEEVPAVINDSVYIMSNAFAFAPHYPAVLATMAKWLYPDLFDDFNPEAIHQEFIDEFMGIDYNVYEQGVFVYPEAS